MLLLAMTLALVKPLPDARDPAEGRRATQCVQYLRLQPTQVPLSAAQCDDQGYGLEFMQAQWQAIDQLERAHAEQLRKSQERLLQRQAIQARRGELQTPCEQLALGLGAGPDGGQALCDLAGWARAPIILRHDHDARLARGEARHRLKIWGAAAAGVAVVLAALWVRARRRQG